MLDTEIEERHIHMCKNNILNTVTLVHMCAYEIACGESFQASGLPIMSTHTHIQLSTGLSTLESHRYALISSRTGTTCTHMSSDARISIDTCQTRG